MQERLIVVGGRGECQKRSGEWTKAFSLLLALQRGGEDRDRQTEIEIHRERQIQRQRGGERGKHT